MKPSLLYVCVILISPITLCHPKDVAYTPAPIDNPLKGLVPYVSQYPPDRFPHSMEFCYLPMRGLMDQAVDPNGSTRYEYDWTPLEEQLDMTTARHCQLIFRIYLEYPGKPIAIPQFLIDKGVKITRWAEPDENQLNLTPDYSNPVLRNAIKAFIAALGQKYDGDPRIAFITAGLLGKWGEWHDWPRSDLFASIPVQQEVMDAYAAAFQTTKILLRYPSGENDPTHAPNAEAPFGFHDDSFAWATLETGRPEDDWYFMARIKKAGPQAMNKWKTYPIGGEIRPELWENSFTDTPHEKQQDFDRCVRETHVSWLMDTGLASPRYPLPENRYEKAVESVQKMGYELHLAAAECLRSDGTGEVTVTVENRGVAPFYYDWPVELGLLNPEGTPIRTWAMPWKLSTLLPGNSVVWKSRQLTLPINAPENCRLAIRIPNPMPSGKPLRLANHYPPETNDWLLLE
jgi:hypothetical protein